MAACGPAIFEPEDFNSDFPNGYAIVENRQAGEWQLWAPTAISCCGRIAWGAIGLANG